ncbi:MAG: oligosaccharide flippase family protein [Chlorobi bacterium]|nr:oligosaccharide flippase family protein [Chlorobiota bacterium]
MVPCRTLQPQRGAFKVIAKRFRGVGVGPDMLLGVILQGLNAATAFGLMLVLVRTLPKEEFGLYSLALAPLGIATGIADFGLVATLMPRMAVARHTPNPAFRTGLLLRGLLILLAWLGMNLYLITVAEPRFLLLVNLGYLAIFFSSKLTGLRQIFEVVWRLKGRGYMVSLFALLDGVLILALVMLLRWQGMLTPERVMVCIAVASVPGFLAIMLPVVVRLRGRGLWVKSPKRYSMAVVRASLPIALFGAVAQMQGQIETLVVGHFGGLQQIAAISVPIRVLQGTLFIAIIASITLAPVVAQVYKRQRVDISLAQVGSVGVRVIGAVGVGISLFCVALAPQIMLIFGAEYAADTQLLRLYSFANMLTFLVVTLDQLLMAMGRRPQVLYGVLFGLAVSIIFEVGAVVIFGTLESVVIAKIFSVAMLVILQTFFLPNAMRGAVRSALLRVWGVAAAVAVAAWVLPQGQVWWRIALLAVAVPLVAAVVRLVTARDVQLLRTVRAS